MHHRANDCRSSYFWSLELRNSRLCHSGILHVLSHPRFLNNHGVYGLEPILPSCQTITLFENFYQTTVYRLVVSILVFLSADSLFPGDNRLGRVFFLSRLRRLRFEIPHANYDKNLSHDGRWADPLPLHGYNSRMLLQSVASRTPTQPSGCMFTAKIISQ